jgi:tetrahydromethanopterin S-methyltransferase subunit A
MSEEPSTGKIQAELQEGMRLAKCRQCGCMNDALHHFKETLEPLSDQDTAELLAKIARWQQEMVPVKYACLGCAYCFPAVATNIFNQAFPEMAQGQVLSCAFEVKEQTWPPVPGEYFAFCDGQDCPVAVSTLASVALAEQLAAAHPKELCIVGKTETENIGIDKVIKNSITNPTIRFLLLTGQDPQGHQPGKTLYALWENGVDETMRVIGSPGKRPVLRNVSQAEVEAFRKQVRVVDLIGCEDVGTIISKLKELAQEPASTCGCSTCLGQASVFEMLTAPVIQAKEPPTIKMDKAGYFVILTQPEKQSIRVEHYTYDNSLLRVIEGKDARSLYWTIIENDWVTLLGHAAYLGKELTRAELSLSTRETFIQEGA